MDRIAAVVLAAGQGIRMKSKYPKVLHPVAGQPMLLRVLDRLAELEIGRQVVVVGWGRQAVRATLHDRAEYVEQAEQLGTGHAVQQAKSTLQDNAETLLVLCGDTPLLRTATLRQLLDLHSASEAAITLLTAEVANPAGYGRILRDELGKVARIVEEDNVGQRERRQREVNSGVYCFNGDWLWSHLPLLQISKKGEYYLTDLVEIAAKDGSRVESLTIEDATEILGVNDRVQLAQVQEIMLWRIRESLMRAGVTLVDPNTCFIDAAVAIGPDTVVLPNALIEGTTQIGSGCTIGPNAHIINSKIRDGCRINASVIEDSLIEEGVSIGPYSHVRGGAVIGQGAFLGNYAEVKKSHIGPGTKMNHFSYIGDATIGPRVNIGAGTITCNFDSETQTKSPTIVEEDAALGSDTMLVAPVKIGARSMTGAGAVVTRDIPPDSVAYGIPAKVKRPRRRSDPPIESGDPK